MKRRLGALLGAVVAFALLAVPAAANHQGLTGLQLNIQGNCFYNYVTSGAYQYAGLGADVSAFENRGDVVQIRVRYLVQYRSASTTDVWTTYVDWTRREFTTNGDTVRYDEAIPSVYIGGDPSQVQDYRVILTVTWIRPTGGNVVHKFTAAQVIDGVCSERIYPSPA